MPVFLVALLLLVSTSGYATDDASSELIERLEMATASAQHQNYQGTLVILKSGDLSTLSVVHGKDQRGVWEELETLTGTPRKVIRQNNRVMSVFPDKGLMTVRESKRSTSLPYSVPESFSRLNEFYEFERLEDDRIAGYPSLVVHLKPRDAYRYGYRYWLDSDKGMLLRCDVFNLQDEVVEQMMFTRLDYLSGMPSLAFKDVELSGYTVKSLQDIIPEPAELMWKVTSLPAGYRLTERHYRGSDSAAFTQLVYSDGLASVSVFIEKIDKNGKYLHGASAVNAVHAYGQRNGDYFVTAVGEVPADTVRRLAKSTRRVPLKQVLSEADDS